MLIVVSLALNNQDLNEDFNLCTFTCDRSLDIILTKNTHKVLRVGHYFPTLLKDALVCVRKCWIFQTRASKEKKSTVDLQLVTSDNYLSDGILTW